MAQRAHQLDLVAKVGGQDSGFLGALDGVAVGALGGGHGADVERHAHHGQIVPLRRLQQGRPRGGLCAVLLPEDHLGAGVVGADAEDELGRGVGLRDLLDLVDCGERGRGR